MTVISPGSKTAIVLFNLGGPDNLQAVKPFLFNLFSDPAIIGLPNPLRYLVAKLISGKRALVAQEIYRNIGGKSPINEQTQAQAMALEVLLKKRGEVKVFTCMRYWHPMSEEVAAQVKAYAPDHVIMLPLYPQFSTTTSGSSFKDWDKAAVGITAPHTKICCYPLNKSFLRAHAASVKPVIEEAKTYGAVRVLFSAHGLPEKIIEKGDPYQWQVEQTVANIIAELDMQGLDAVTCYQSKVGPLKWIGPSTEDEIKRAGDDKVPLVVVPVAFVSEHSETLVELDIEYKELAHEAGVPDYRRVPALAIHARYIEALAELCLSVKPGYDILSHQKVRLCPARYSQCPHHMEKAA